MTIDLPLSEEEWEEMCALKRAINDGPSCIAPQKMERFSELFVRTLHGKGDTMLPATELPWQSPTLNLVTLRKN